MKKPFYRNILFWLVAAIGLYLLSFLLPGSQPALLGRKNILTPGESKELDSRK